MGKYNEELVKAGVLLVAEAADFGPELTPALREQEERQRAQAAANQ